MQSDAPNQADIEARWRRDDPSGARMFDVLVQRQQTGGDFTGPLVEAIAAVVPVPHAGQSS